MYICTRMWVWLYSIYIYVCVCRMDVYIYVHGESCEWVRTCSRVHSNISCMYEYMYMWTNSGSFALPMFETHGFVAVLAESFVSACVCVCAFVLSCDALYAPALSAFAAHQVTSIAV